MNDYTNLEPGQERAIIALLSEPTLKAAAASAGISETTLWRWLRDPNFAQAYREARREAIEQATAQLQALASEAVRTLGQILRDDKAAAHVRASAAARVLTLAYKSRELDDLESRLEALEEASV
jgi:uncharacterized protein YggE